MFSVYKEYTVYGSIACCNYEIAVKIIHTGIYTYTASWSCVKALATFVCKITNSMRTRK